MPSRLPHSAIQARAAPSGVGASAASPQPGHSATQCVPGPPLGGPSSRGLSAPHAPHVPREASRAFTAAHSSMVSIRHIIPSLVAMRS